MWNLPQSLCCKHMLTLESLLVVRCVSMAFSIVRAPLRCLVKQERRNFRALLVTSPLFSSACHSLSLFFSFLFPSLFEENNMQKVSVFN